jgi:predicted esterase
MTVGIQSSQRGSHVRILKRVTAVLLLLVLPVVARAEFVQRVITDDAGEHRYTVFLPEGYTATKKWPVILYLHGAGERGKDGQRQLTIGLAPAIQKRQATFPFVAVFPQSEDDSARYLAGWLADSPDSQRALAILDEVEREYSIDTSRRILTGWSMGGYGTWSIAAADPSKWQAILPLSGGGAEVAKKLTDLPIWAFHGAEDAAIRPSQSRRTIAALRSAGVDPRYTEVSGGQHDITHVVYDTDAVTQWMLDPDGAHPRALALSVPANDASVDNSPFIPALELEGAATIRLGNTMLDALAMSIPDHLPKDLMRGSLPDINDGTVVEGRQFNITFGRISYSADLFRVRLHAYQKDRLNVQIGVRQAVLRIGGTSVVGRDHSASTGPIDIVIGHREPVWLSFDVTPYIENRKLKLKQQGTRFDIPYDNWYVTAPADVNVRGFGMTRDKVSQGLVEGLYGNKARIEQQVRSLVPQLVTAMEERLQLDQANSMVSSFWPLPVYSPRVRIWPQDVSTDESGISVVLGVTAASVTPESAPDKPARQVVTDITADSVNKTTDLQVTVAPNMLSGLTGLLVAADVAKINVLDVPDASFAGLADRAALTKAFPELAGLGPDAEISSELHLAQPIAIGNAQESDGMSFQAPGILFRVATRTGGATSDWSPFANIQYSVNQAAVTSLQRVDDQRRALRLKWDGETAVSVNTSFAEGYTPSDATINDDALISLFRESWKRWTDQGPASQTIIPDFDLGLTQLRLTDVSWDSPALAVTFSPPGVKLTNSVKENLVYETKGPFSGWGGPFTLTPGNSHEYPIAYPLIYRRRIDGQYVQYALAPGSHSEFRVPQTGGSPRLFKAREDLDVGNVDATTAGTGEAGNEATSSKAPADTSTSADPSSL